MRLMVTEEEVIMIDHDDHENFDEEEADGD